MSYYILIFTSIIIFSVLSFLIYNFSVNSTLEKNFLLKKPILIIISFDGFRNEYLQRNVTPNLLKLRKNGVYSDYMINVFPTKTFTNHYSIITGIYADAHGILANHLYDEKIKRELKYGDELYHYNSKVLPIWSINEKIKNSYSGCMMWPGTNFNFSDISCTHLQEYNKTISLKDRIDIMIKWLNDPEKPANLIMFYSEQPDKLAHAEGPDSNNITKKLAELDKVTKYLNDQLAENNLLNRTNIILISDHGMSGVSSKKFINLTNYIESGSAKFYGSSPVMQIVPLPGKVEEVYERLKNASRQNKHFDVYYSEDLPKRWHAYNQQRFSPIIAVAKMNYAFHDMWKFVKNDSLTEVFGIHGYDNQEILIHPIFMAKGPSIKTGGRKIKPFETIKLFQLFLYLLGLSNASDVVSEIISE